MIQVLPSSIKEEELPIKIEPTTINSGVDDDDDEKQLKYTKSSVVPKLHINISNNNNNDIPDSQLPTQTPPSHPINNTTSFYTSPQPNIAVEEVPKVKRLNNTTAINREDDDVSKKLILDSPITTTETVEPATAKDNDKEIKELYNDLFEKENENECINENDKGNETEKDEEIMY